jgi:hypothetical protein
MKITSIIVSVLAAVSFMGCATTKYKTFSNPDSFKAATKSVQGKTPKEAAKILGAPMSAYFKNGAQNEYHMVYPMGDQEVGMTDLMFNDRLECLDLIFEKDKAFKFDNWSSNTGFTCGAIKGEKLDMSLIEN